MALTYDCWRSRMRIGMSVIFILIVRYYWLLLQWLVLTTRTLEVLTRICNWTPEWSLFSKLLASSSKWYCFGGLLCDGRRAWRALRVSSSLAWRGMLVIMRPLRASGSVHSLLGKFNRRAPRATCIELYLKAFSSIGSTVAGLSFLPCNSTVGT